LDGDGDSVAACALRAEPVRYRWELADSLRRMWYLRQQFDRWHETSAAGLAAAEQENDLRGQASMHLSLGTLHCELDGRQGVGHLETALELYGEIGDQAGEFHCLNNLAVLHLALGRTRDAIGLLRRAMPLVEDNARLTAVVHLNLGAAAAQSGRLRESLEHCERARDLPDPRVDFALGEIHALLGDPVTAREYVDRGARAAAGSSAHLLAEARIDRDTGRVQRALARALELVDEDGAGLDALLGLVIVGTAHHRLGQLDEAAAALRRGLELAESWGRVENQTEYLIDLARVLHAAGDESAPDLAERALVRATEHGFLLQRGRALATLALLSLKAGDGERARALAAEAVAVQRETGFASGEAEARLLLSRIDDPAGARATEVRGGDPAGVLCETDFD
jgi:tetratricopeptide (TPR) repeat protein